MFAPWNWVTKMSRWLDRTLSAKSEQEKMMSIKLILSYTFSFPLTLVLQNFSPMMQSMPTYRVYVGIVLQAFVIGLFIFGKISQQTAKWILYLNLVVRVTFGTKFGMSFLKQIFNSFNYSFSFVSFFFFVFTIEYFKKTCLYVGISNWKIAMI